MKQGIADVDPLDTLEFISQACQIDHPGLSEVVSGKMNAVSMASTKRHDIQAWASEVQSEAHDIMDDLEDLTITELKHLLREKITLQPTSTAQGLFSVGSALEQRGARVAQV